MLRLPSHPPYTYSRIMFKVSADFTNPWYLTILGCYILVSRRYTRSQRMSYIQILQEVDFQLKHFLLADVLHHQWVTTNHDNTQFAFGKVHQLDLLHCNSLPGIPVQRTVDRSECSFPQAIAQLLFSRIPKSAFVSYAQKGPDPYIILQFRDILGRRLGHLLIPILVLSLRWARPGST